MGRTSSTCKFHTKPNYNVKIIESIKEEILDSSSCFHFALVNISSKNLFIPILNRTMCEIT